MGGREVLQLHMNGGNGKRSYANNSSIQRNIILKAKPVLEEIITKQFYNCSTKCIKVADLGCSVGPNTLLATSNIIDTTSKCFNRSSSPIMFQIYLNDLFGNDFNTIFKSLPDFYRRLEEENGHNNFGMCFINATPGSFYGRLFPSNSINLFHSSNSLHWLSQDPFLGLTTKEGEPLINKSNCYITSSTPSTVYKAYLNQFQEGFKIFLKSRSEELVPGGALVLVLLGRDEVQRSSIWEVVSLTLTDMLLEGLIEEEKVDSFNIPTYEPTMEEVREVIEEEGSLSLQRLEFFTLPWDDGINELGGGTDQNIIRAEFIAKYTRSVMEPLLSVHFGANILDELFIRLQKKILQLMELEKLEYSNLVMSITKMLDPIQLILFSTRSLKPLSLIFFLNGIKTSYSHLVSSLRYVSLCVFCLIMYY